MHKTSGQELKGRKDKNLICDFFPPPSLATGIGSLIKAQVMLGGGSGVSGKDQRTRVEGKQTVF